MTIVHCLNELNQLLKNSNGDCPGGWELASKRKSKSMWELLQSLGTIQVESTDAYKINAHDSVGPVDRIDSLILQLAQLDSADQCPILAITGMLNAGKSSLLAGFLSDEGRKRILIGLANDQGTHRFVLWLPESWKRQQNLWNLVLSQLQQVFGQTVEMLSDNHEEAYQQYNGKCFQRLILSAATNLDQENSQQAQDLIRIPLIATDRLLDNLGIALLDCPDIQTGSLAMDSSTSVGQAISTHQDMGQSRMTYAERSAKIARHRAEVLSQAFRLCSAFVMVIPGNALHDQFVSDLLTEMKLRMPSLERILVVNRVQRKYLCSDIADEVSRTYASHDLGRVYMAYHFDGPLLRERLPPTPDGFSNPSDATLPILFQILPGPTPQPPQPLDPSRYLIELGKQLDRGRLMSDCRESLVRQLAHLLKASVSQLEKASIERAERLGRIYRILADATLEFSLDSSREATAPNPLRLHASREIVNQISSSLERTAPWWAKPSRYVVWLAEATKRGVSQATTSVLPMGWLGNKSREIVDYVQGKFRRGEVGKVISSHGLAELLRRHDYQNDIPSNASAAPTLEQRCQSMIDRFQNESQTRLDDESLDQYTSQIWSQMNWKQRLWTGVMPASVVFAPLLAAMALPFDFGGTSILLLASVKELLFAVGAGASVALLSRDKMPKIAEEEAAIQQLSDLYAIGCDELGLFRPSSRNDHASNESTPMALPSITVGQSRLTLRPGLIALSDELVPSVVPLPLDVNPDFRTRMDRILKSMLVKEDL